LTPLSALSTVIRVALPVYDRSSLPSVALSSREQRDCTSELFWAKSRFIAF
jgi:hypothetical protein